MLKSRTVFVLGAGSSNEIGLPLGVDLKQEIANALDFRFERGFSMVSGDELIYHAISAHIRDHDSARTRDGRLHFAAAHNVTRAMSQAPSIDNYLEAHADNEEIILCGKLAIARSILLAEGSSLFQYSHSNQSAFDHDQAAKTWYGKLFQLLVERSSKAGIDALLGNVSFISFNYDRSLERYLPFAIENYFDCGLDKAYELVRKVKIFHPYGVCGSLPWQNQSMNVPYGGSDNVTELLEVANKIHTFSEQISDEKSLAEMRAEVANAQTVVFLGFGFHEMNMGLLTVPSSNVVRVFATAYGLSESDAAVVESRVLGALDPTFKSIGQHIRLDLKCSDLFSEFRLSLAA